MLISTLNIKVDKDQLYNVVHVSGKLDTTVIKKFTDTCSELSKNKHLIFDLNELEYISSTGIGEMFRFMQEIESSGYKFIIAALQPSVLNVIKLTKLEQFFKIEESIEKAVKTVTSG
ncbi:MAG: STAS domain-containing protein [Spirochaetes bacterium]|nr:STAS domain-containing protein [Spirochaetota bacterium]